MIILERSQREAVIAEALTWEGTPFHHEARVKGHAVDCGQFLAGVYIAAGLIPADFKVAPYSSQHHLHRRDEMYLEILEALEERLIEYPEPADVAIWKMGRTYSHAALVIAWPQIIHASALLGRVCRDNALNSPLQLTKYPVRFYSRWGGA